MFSLKVWVNQKKVRQVESLHSRAPSKVREPEWEWENEIENNHSPNQE